MTTTHPYLTNRNGATLVERITTLRELVDGWYNGEGKGVTKQSCDLAEHVVPLVFRERPDHKPYIYPMPDGGLQVETDCKGYSYHIRFMPDGATIEVDCFYDPPFNKEDSSLELHGLTKDDFVVVLDDWIEFL